MEIGNVYWICGSVLGGKSSIADRLGDEFGVAVYHMDEYQIPHISRATEREQPMMFRMREARDSGKSFADLLVEETADGLIDGYLRHNREHFELTLEDIDNLGHDRLIVEGIAARPDLLHDVVRIDHAVCILTPTTFRDRIRESIGARTKNERQFRRHSKSEIALRERGRLHELAAEHILESAMKYGFRTIINDGSTTLDENFSAVRQHFGF